MSLQLKKHALYSDQYVILRPGSEPEITRIVGRALRAESLGHGRTGYDLYLLGVGTDKREPYRHLIEHFAGPLKDLKAWLRDRSYDPPKDTYGPRFKVDEFHPPVNHPEITSLDQVVLPITPSAKVEAVRRGLEDGLLNLTCAVGGTLHKDVADTFPETVAGLVAKGELVAGADGSYVLPPSPPERVVPLGSAHFVVVEFGDADGHDTGNTVCSYGPFDSEEQASECAASFSFSDDPEVHDVDIHVYNIVPTSFRYGDSVVERKF